jgi:hypothetical protein
LLLRFAVTSDCPNGTRRGASATPHPASALNAKRLTGLTSPLAVCYGGRTMFLRRPRCFARLLDPAWAALQPRMLAVSLQRSGISFGAANRIYGTKPSEPLESTTGSGGVAPGSPFTLCGISVKFSVEGSYGERPSLPSGFSSEPEGHDELKGQFVEATRSGGLPHSESWRRRHATEMDCLTEQSQFILKTKDLSRNKPKQSQIIIPILSRKSLIQKWIDRSWRADTRNIHKQNDLIASSGV